MNILFVYPKYPDTFWSFKHVLGFISKKASLPPLGLLTVASMLPEEWNKRLVDTNVEDLTDEAIAWADMVFVGGMVVQKASAQHIIQWCKAHGKKIVCGGPLFSTQHKNFPEVDHFILDEAEVTLPLFLKDLEEKNPKRIYRSKERPDITKTPLPMWNLINLKHYATMSVQYSRGCPFNCEFCDIVIMNGRIPRTKTTEQMVAEFQALYDAGWRGHLFIVDDNFIGNKMKVLRMLPEIIKWQKKRRYPFTLMTEASTNLADSEELMNLMSAANFSSVFLGIETPCVDSLKDCGKTQNVMRDLKETVKTIQQHGMDVMGGFIVGFDTDKESIFEAQIKFIQQVGIVTAMVGLLNAAPQTRLWHRLKAEGRLVNEMSGENTDGTMNFIPKLDKQVLMDGYKKILGTIYSHKMYYRRIQTFLKNYKPTVRGRITKEKISAFLKSMWVIGVRSRARWHYWWLLLKTSVRRIKVLPKAVELAIYGQHFEKITKRTLAS